MTLMPSNAVLPSTIPPRRQASVGKYITFELAGDLFALPIQNVRDILSHRQAAENPNCILHQQTQNIIDVRPALDRPRIAPTPESCLIVIEHSRQSAALVVDRIAAVVSLSDRALKPASAIDIQLIAGSAIIDDQHCIVLDPQSLLYSAN